MIPFNACSAKIKAPDDAARRLFYLSMCRMRVNERL